MINIYCLQNKFERKTAGQIKACGVPLPYPEPWRCVPGPAVVSSPAHPAGIYKRPQTYLWIQTQHKQISYKTLLSPV